MPIGSDFIDQGGQVRCIDLVGQLDGIGAIRGVGIDQQMAQSVEAHEVERLERDLIPRQRLEDRRNGGQRSLLFFVDGSGKRIGFGLAGRKYAVDDQVLL